ncbi:NADH dehydrogenase [Colwellia sp. MT41]|uniref:complex I subunit 4 family protein n=1 Tax=Colwellia sp. MT41 TaxID=58049 RepID=UPI000717B900|nr:NADH-quinone oxidoreductase subunit M [Colwellia sp. MT41]ALO35151.1 NADH dehydrogenase [Colwellia sp. MT41]
MTLFILLLMPLLGGLLAWYSERFDADLPKKIALLSLLLCWLPLIPLLSSMPFDASSLPSSQWLIDESYPWIPFFNINAHLALDGLSLLLILLTLLMGLVALSSAWHEITKRTGLFYLNLLWTLAGVIGVFLAIDLFLFFVFWEVMLVPMYFLISIWGYEQRHYAAVKFFIFTQAGGLLMLISLCALVGIHYQQTGILTFDYLILIQNPISGDLAFWVALGFTIAFLVKLPALPFHSWLADAHTQAPTAASVILAAVLLKTGGYGIIRFVLPLFPQASIQLAPFMMLLGVIGIIYGAMMAFVQTDLKRLVAYSSVSHMGFVLLGCFALNIYALQGAIMQMLAHGISTSALFVLVGMIQHRYHTRDLNKLGGLWLNLPKLSAFGLFFGIASLGMPGLGNFVAEFLILVGSFEQYPILTIFAASGLILAAVYSLLLIYKTFFGPIKRPHDSKITDTNTKEWCTLISMCFILIYLGLHPQPFFDLVPITLMKLNFIAADIGALL